MDSPANSLCRFMHRYFFPLLIGSYMVAGFFPGPGLALRRASLGEVSLFGEHAHLTAPTLMLSLLLFNAGLGLRPAQLPSPRRSVRLLVAGLLANTLIPLLFIFGVCFVLLRWHNSDEVQNILVGLALVASMPVAGSSTAWSQNADGDLTLSLGLVLGSTLLSPLTTPAALHAVGWLAQGDYSEDLHELAASGANGFLLACVVLPSLAGLATRWCLGEARAVRAAPRLKLINSVNLLQLNYSNAAVSLPEAVRNPDPDFLAVTLALALVLCVLGFATGAWLARLTGSGRAQRASLMFGLGMNNNGTGLVLASLALADHPRVMLPIIFYNLVQHLVAGAVSAWPGAPAEESSTLDGSAPPTTLSPDRVGVREAQGTVAKDGSADGRAFLNQVPDASVPTTCRATSATAATSWQQIRKRSRDF
jgi:bile acid:Na+ symporter, BASS family